MVNDIETSTLIIFIIYLYTILNIDWLVKNRNKCISETYSFICERTSLKLSEKNLFSGHRFESGHSAKYCNNLNKF